MRISSLCFTLKSSIPLRTLSFAMELLALLLGTTKLLAAGTSKVIHIEDRDCILPNFHFGVFKANVLSVSNFYSN